jgi:hypothetical protein
MKPVYRRMLKIMKDKEAKPSPITAAAAPPAVWSLYIL